jgi:hypothetical protein
MMWGGIKIFAVAPRVVYRRVLENKSKSFFSEEDFVDPLEDALVDLEPFLSIGGSSLSI